METPIEYLEREYAKLYGGIVKISMLSSFETAKKMEQERSRVKNSVVLDDVSNRRELLLDFAEYSENDKTSTAIDECVDNYLDSIK